jgi:Phage integrase family
VPRPDPCAGALRPAMGRGGCVRCGSSASTCSGVASRSPRRSQRSAADWYGAPPKNHQIRSVPVPGFLADLLAEVVAGMAPSDLVFTTWRGKPLRNLNFRRDVFDRAAVDAVLEGLTPHELRHTAASLAVSAGANVKAVQRMLGHASAAMTLDIYAGLFADDLDAVADRLDRAVVKLNADQMRATAHEPVIPDRAALRESARTGRWLGQTTQSRLGESNPGPTHHEIVQRFTVVDGWSPLRLRPCPTVRGWRRLVMAGVGRAGAHRGQPAAVAGHGERNDSQARPGPVAHRHPPGCRCRPSHVRRSSAS